MRLVRLIKSLVEGELVLIMLICAMFSIMCEMRGILFTHEIFLLAFKQFWTVGIMMGAGIYVATRPINE